MVDTLELIEIDTADSFDELCELEKHYIEEYKSFYMDENKSYNMTRGGASPCGYIYTEDDKRRNSERMVQYYDNHPEKRRDMSEKIKQYFEDPEVRKKQSERMKKYYEEHPEAKTDGTKMKLYYNENPGARQKMSEIKKRHFEENPEAGTEHGKRMKKYFENPEHKKNIAKTKGCNKPFDVFKCDGTYVGTFCYTFECKAYLQKEYGNIPNIQGVKITYVLAGQRKSSHGFTFKYK
jgi:hypothetical protein